ncbi:MAG TPA: hypothetical protein VLT91_12075 [Rhizomicrobium sp.]|nr:hypothetical protein [Rhizomicrobium sp.]
MSLLVMAGAARADDQPFINIYTTDIETEGGKELEQKVIWATQKPGQSYNSILSRTEVEWGVTDDFQVSLSGNYEWERIRLHAPSGANTTEREFSVSGEAIYRFLNVYFDPVGLAVYLEPSFGDKSRELEAKILLQKNFFNDDLRIAANINFENTWERDSGNWNKGSAIEFFLGAAYNVTPEFSVGMEFNNENEFEGLIGGAHPASNVYYLGPTLHYEGHPFKVTLGAQAQLPWANDASHAPGTVRDGFHVDAERYRLGIQISTDI